MISCIRMDAISTHDRMRWARRYALAVTTAVFFLLCHGLLGSSHALGMVALPSGMLDGTASHQTGEHEASGSGVVSGTGEASPSHLAHGGEAGFAYTSVITALTFGALFLLASVPGFVRLDLLTSLRSGREIIPKGLTPSRRPTRPALQVFLL